MPSFSAEQLLTELRRVQLRLQRLLADGHLNETVARRLLDDIARRIRMLEEQILFVKEHTRADQEALIQISQVVLPKFTHLTASLESGILHEVRTGIRKGEDQREVVQRIIAKFGRAEHNARTLVNTANAGVANADSIQQALAAGITRFRYMGPAPEREFCQNHLGKVYSIEVIRRMDNGQRIPVEYFCGGYNCRHQWVATGEPAQAAPTGTPQDQPRRVRTPRPAAAASLAPAPALTGPTGERVSTRVDNRIPGGANRWKKDGVNEALRAIDAVHGVSSSVPTIPIKASKSRAFLGCFEVDPYTRAPKRILIADTDHPELTTAHEMGHFLDHQAFGTPGAFSSVRDELMERWRLAVIHSRAFHDMGEDRAEWRTPRLRRTQDYYLSLHECWARAYAQYITLRSGNTKMRRQLTGILGNQTDLRGMYRYSQWEDDDFEPIARAMDEIFQAAGMRA